MRPDERQMDWQVSNVVTLGSDGVVASRLYNFCFYQMVDGEPGTMCSD